MKPILTALLILSGLIVSAQEMYLMKVTSDYEGSEKTVITEFFYDDYGNLLEMKTERYDPDDVPHHSGYSYYYENDTLFQFYAWPENYGWELVYTEDSIIKYPTNTSARIYYVSDHVTNQIDSSRSINSDASFSFVWQNDNVLNWGLGYEMTYYEDVLNPYYHAFKYFRFDYQSSMNYLEYFAVNSYFEVVDTLNGYPTEVRNYYFDNLGRTYFFEYDYLYVNTSEITSEEPSILSVQYFDLMGRSIPKPDKGFFIERKATDKGVVATKHFIN